MSREIKFRVFIKNIIGGFMIPSDNSDCFMVSNGTGFVVYDENKNTLKETDFEIMQFTGLKDKNGVEIYEGDIVQFQNDECESSLAKIEFRKEIAAFVVVESGGWDSIELMEEGVVIGNIHENPELLNN